MILAEWVVHKQGDRIWEWEINKAGENKGGELSSNQSQNIHYLEHILLSHFIAFKIHNGFPIKSATGNPKGHLSTTPLPPLSLSHQRY